MTVSFRNDIEIMPELPPDHRMIERSPRLWRLAVTGPLGPLLSLLEGMPVKDLDVAEARLEDVVLSYYREEAP